MSWLNANEYFFIEFAARDRVEDLRSTIDLTPASPARGEPISARRHSQRVRARTRAEEGQAASAWSLVMPAARKTLGWTHEVCILSERL